MRPTEPFTPQGTARRRPAARIALLAACVACVAAVAVAACAPADDAATAESTLIVPAPGDTAGARDTAGSGDSSAAPSATSMGTSTGTSTAPAAPATSRAPAAGGAAASRIPRPTKPPGGDLVVTPVVPESLRRAPATSTRP